MSTNQEQIIDKGVTKPGQDRYKDAELGVKRTYRPDWLDSENKLFINELNFCAKHFKET